MLAAGRVLRHCATYLAFDPKGPDDEYVSVLPLPWIMEQVYVLGKGLLCRMKINFVEQPDTMMNDFREIAPTFVLFAPRVWESIAADVRAGVMDSSPLKQSLYELGMKTGLSALAHGKHSAIADMLLFRALRDRLGFTRLRSAATGGAALGPDTFKFFQAMGVPLRTLYGQTELLGAYTLHPFGPGRSRHHGRADGRQHRNPHRQSGHPRRRRDRGAPPQHVPRLLQEPGSLRRRHARTAGCIRAMPAISTPTSSSW